jgi:hypothetical protein
MTQVTMWGLPYFLGRVYLSDLRSLKELAVGMFISGLVYVPFCLFEVRMSPQLEAIVYGGRMRSGIRLGGWRPAVFMQSGLELVMWMSVCSLIVVQQSYKNSFRIGVSNRRCAGIHCFASQRHLAWRRSCTLGVDDR